MLLEYVWYMTNANMTIAFRLVLLNSSIQMRAQTFVSRGEECTKNTHSRYHYAANYLLLFFLRMILLVLSATGIPSMYENNVYEQVR